MIMATISCVLQQTFVETFDHVDLEYDADYSVAEGKSWCEDVELNLLTDDWLDGGWDVTLQDVTVYKQDEDGVTLSCGKKSEVVTETKPSKVYVLDTSVYTVWGLEIIWEDVLEDDESQGR